MAADQVDGPGSIPALVTASVIQRITPGEAGAVIEPPLRWPPELHAPPNNSA